MRLTTFFAAATASGLAIISGQSAVAANIEAISTIVSAVVQPDAATITREANIDLPVGASSLVIKGATSAIIPQSLRVSGEARTPLIIGAVEERATPAIREHVDTAIVARLNDLRAARGAVDVTMESLKAKQAMILRYSQASPEKLSGDARSLAVSEWTAAFDAIAAAHAKAGEELRLAIARARLIDEEIKGLESGQGEPKTWLTSDIIVGVESKTGGPARIILSYQTAAARWTPVYEARLDTGDKDRKPKLELLRAAVITQATGEDWREIELSVSSARARRGATAPEVIPQRVAFADAMPTPMAMSRARNEMSGSAAAPPQGPTPSLKTVHADAPAREETAELEATAYSATFKIAGSASAPGDGTAKTFPLSSRRLEPKLVVRAAPELDPSAYLQAHIVNEEDAPLLPGQLTVERDGVFVGTSRIGFVAPGDAADFGFGADDRVKIARTPVKRKENEPTWFGQTKVETREFATSVKNLHGFPISVLVLDKVPFSENTAISVETLAQTTPPTEKQVGDKRGVLAWSFELQPNEAKDIHLAWQLKWPADREIVPEPAPH